MSEDKIIEEPEDLPVLPSGRSGRSHPLRDALRRARQQEADRGDVIVDLREAEIARLELLQDELGEVFEDIPEDLDLLECALVPSTPPRLWVDVLGHVVMGRDKRTYRFLKDTRYGRQVILETTSLDEMASRVTDYVAHRLIERERALDSERNQALEEPSDVAEPAIEETAIGETAIVGENPGKPFGWWAVIFLFLVGIVIGAAGLFGLGLVLTGN